MSPTQARVLCLVEAARVVTLHGPGLHELEHVEQEDVPVVWEAAYRLADELHARARALEESEPAQLELFAEVRP